MTLKEFFELCNEYDISFSIDNFDVMTKVIFRGMDYNGIEHKYRRSFASDKANLSEHIEETLKNIIDLVKEEEL